MWLLILGVIIFYTIYIIVIKPLGHWKKRNVPHCKSWPVLGSMASFVFRKKSSQELFEQLYNEFPNERYIGMHLFVRPALLIRDPELIKQLTIKDFDYFTDHAIFRAVEEVDPVLSKTLLMLRGQAWRDIRAKLSPCFTANKMKFMFSLISECASNFTKFFRKEDSGLISVETVDFFSRFVVDAIATTAYGVKVDSLKNRHNDFFVLGKKVCKLEGLAAVRLIIYSTVPAIMKFLGIPAVSRKYIDYFENVFKDVIQTREATGSVRPDLVQLLLERREIKLSEKGDLSDECLIAQAEMFFLAGFANTTTTMCFLSYELALNPSVQERLQKEIDETLHRCQGDLTYEALFGMKYMDMVVSELLRLWPPGSIFDRICIRDYVIAPKLPHEQPLLVEKGTVLLFSLSALQHDPKYFSNPTKFDPERFNDENRRNINSFTNIPFGAGPRYCLAMRFVLMEIKILFFHLLSAFDIVRLEKTTVPVIQSKFKLNLGAEGGIWVGLQQRKFGKLNQ